MGAKQQWLEIPVSEFEIEKINWIETFLYRFI
jgi:hypothetical protein